MNAERQSMKVHIQLNNGKVVEVPERTAKALVWVKRATYMTRDMVAEPIAKKVVEPVDDVVLNKDGTPRKKRGRKAKDAGQ